MTSVAVFCRAKGLRLNRDLGQHFLTDEGVLDTIVEAAHILPSDTIVEIGPGIGVLTKELVQRAKRVIAIERDARFPALIREFTANPANLTIILGNALRVSFPADPYTIVANIPYHITSPLLRHAFLESPRPPRTATLLLQRDVAEKIVDAKHAGLLGITVRLFGEPRIIARVPPGAFLPPPKVESAILQIESFSEPRANRKTIDRLLRLAKTAFGQKRKMLRRSIGAFHGGMELLSTASVRPERRPETLTIEEWLALAQASLDREG